jgi:hypothetical protein
VCWPVQDFAGESDDFAATHHSLIGELPFQQWFVGIFLFIPSDLESSSCCIVGFLSDK